MIAEAEKIEVYDKNTCTRLDDFVGHFFECNVYEVNMRIVKMTHLHKIKFAFKKDDIVYLKYETWKGEFWIIGNGKKLLRDTKFIFKNGSNNIKREEII